MELEQLNWTRQSHINIMNKYINPRDGKNSPPPPPPPPPSPSRNDLCKRSESFRKLGVGVPMAGGVSDMEKRLSWLRSQIIGEDAEFDSPFGRRRLTHADSTASGRCVRYVEDFIVDNILPFYGNSHTNDSHMGRRTTKAVHEASSYIKRCLGGGPEDAILFCGSGTTGSIKRLQEVMGIAVPSILRERMIKCMPSEERWVILVGPYEHHSNLLSWRQSLAEVIEIGLDEDGLMDTEDLRQKLESFRDANRPILGSFSACSNVTGIYTDTRAVARLLHQFGAFACFDFAASAPYVEIDMRSGEIDGYDAIFLSVHKFLGGPGSPGILLMSKTLYQLGSSPPSTCGGGTVDYVNGFNEKDTLYVEDIEERENAGTPQIIQITRAALAFWLKDYVGYEVIEKLEDKYIKEAIKRLSTNQNIEILGNKTAKRQAILSFLIYSTTNSPPDCDKKGRDRGLYLWGEMGNERDKPLHGPFVATLLNDLFGIQARGGCACAGPYGHSLLGISEAQSHAYRCAIQKGFVGVKPGWTRVSFPYYLSEEEFQYIIAALEFVASYGQRFLPLYHFNLKTGNWTFKKKAFMEIVGKERKGKTFISNDNQAGKNLNGDARHESLITKYTSYWERAKHIAGLLPKFPSLLRPQVEIDPELLYFRISFEGTEGLLPRDGSASSLAYVHISFILIDGVKMCCYFQNKWLAQRS